MNMPERKQNNKLIMLLTRDRVPRKSSRNALLLEYLDIGPTTHVAIRLVKCNHFGQAEPEIHLEFRSGVWLPFYYFNEVSGNEIHLYHRIGNELLVNHSASVFLIEMVGLFEWNLFAEGFIEELNGNLYQSLLARMAGAA